VRTKLGLGEGPLASVQETLLKPLGIVVLWVVLPETIDAVAMASEETGAVIVANPQGIHMKTASGRRVAFAHELCHLLFDRPEMHRFARACAMEGEPVGQQRDWFERVEQRARAFALALLAPEKAVKACWQRTQALSEELRVQEIMAYFGIGYQAARSHLHNHGLLDLQARLPGLPIASIQGLEGLDPLPPPSISPLLRSGVLRELATLAVRQGLVSPRWAEEQRWGPLQAPLVRASSEASAWGYRTTSMGVLEES
jgi:Zn-dependent peptidase ImmA (M78 family)